MNLRDLTPWHHEKAGSSGAPAITELHREVDRVFDDFWRGFGGPSLFSGNGGAAMAFDIRVDTSEDDKAYHVTAELPGMSEKDVEVTFADNMLTISGEKKEVKEVKEENLHRRERSFGSFRRAFTLPTEIDEAKIAATFKDGVMTIDLPKSKTAQKKAKKITISRGK